jgi:hypothetical protein
MFWSCARVIVRLMMNMPSHYVTTFELLQFQFWHNRLWRYSSRLSQIFRYFCSFCWWCGVCDWVTRQNSCDVSVRCLLNGCGKSSVEESGAALSPSVFESVPVLGNISVTAQVPLPAFSRTHCCLPSVASSSPFYFYTLLFYVLLSRQIFGVPRPFLLSSLLECTVFRESTICYGWVSAHLVWTAFVVFSVSWIF